MQTVDNAAAIIEAVKEKLFPTEEGVAADPSSALRYLQRAISICGETPAISLLQAQAYLQEKEYEVAANIATYE